MTPDQMAKAAQKRLQEWINRSAGQHIRQMKAVVAKDRSGQQGAKP